MLVGRDGRERVEIQSAAAIFEVEAVHFLDEFHLGVQEAAVGREGGAADGAACAELEAADEFLLHKGVGRTAFAVAREVEELAVAALREVDVEDAFNAKNIIVLGGRRRSVGACWSRRWGVFHSSGQMTRGLDARNSVGDKWHTFTASTPKTSHST